MNSILNIFSNLFLWGAVASWILAQGLKVPIHALTDHRWDFKYFWSPGGMPSSHSASALSVAILVGAKIGWGSAEVAMAVGFSAIVMYDAAGGRRETGRQGAAINEILSKVMVDGKPISDEELKEIVGHSPFEVLMGALTGTIVAIVLLLCFG